ADQSQGSGAGSSQLGPSGQGSVEFQRPGVPAPPPSPPAPDNGAVAPAPVVDNYHLVPIPDRWRIIEALGVKDDPLSPYQQNTVKGDRPVFDDWFVELSGVLDTTIEPRSFPVPVAAVISKHPGANSNFGNPRQLFFSETAIPTLEIIKGD